ncbi:DEAD/DEAH box helicase [Lactobacillus sp. B4005]|uniref:DEAD/DEAH box helicase n=1 Tax=Lactobacillus sp. B4005 TaxID=2818031 RepID=UPI00226A0AF3|nr:DEAD/DEAH box helicase [Lactobacillus sp. B4005]MCX8723365.1 DEAD/DEAH box helicase [Lactobacillus sp. B4005]
MKFSELGLNDELLKAIKRSGFEEATPIQEQTIPLALAGKDVIGQAQTGTGKTAAFALPILQNLDKHNKAIQALIIEPTRELAIQTQEELFRLGRDEKARVQVVYGGADIGRQIRSLKNHVPAILVGTPGRLLDHLKRKTINLENVNTIVLDEADEMLDMGFIQDIESILGYVKNRKQTLLFSATMPKPILNISEKFMHDPEIVRIKTKELTADLIDQYFVRSKDSEKFDIMCRLIDVESPDLAVIFVRTKRRVDEVTRGLQARGYNAAGIHGDLSQARRISVLKRFRSGKLDILVATDVAARGLDISGVTHVYNYDIPQDPDSYVHRIGRTGRAGQNGSSITFVTPNEIGYMRTIEQLTKKKMTPLRPPSDDQAFRGQLKVAKSKIEDLMKEDLTKYTDDASELLENYSAIDLVSAFLKNLSKDSSNVEVKISSEKPLPYKGGGRRGGGRGRGHYSRGRNGGGRGGYRGGDRGHGGRGNYRGGRSNRSGGSHNFVIKNKKD